MNKAFFLTSLLSLSLTAAQAQFKISQDIVGTPVGAKPEKTFIGSEYLYPKFVKGHVLQQNDTYYNDMELNYDVLSDKLVFLKEGQEMAFKLPIKEFQIIKSATAPVKLEVYRNGFPASGSFTDKSFYQVINDGKVMVLRKPVKSITESTPYGSAKVQKNIVNGEQYFIFKDGKMDKIKKDKKDLLSALSDKKDQLDEFIKTKKLNLKSDDDIKALLDYYNSLSGS